MTEGAYNAVQCDVEEPEYVHYFDNIDKARGWVDNKLAGLNAVANHPGNYVDTFVYDKEYHGVNNWELKHFKYIKMELL